MTVTDPPAATSPDTGHRLVGIDAARAVAIIGMFLIHFFRSGDGPSTALGSGGLRSTGLVAGPAAMNVLFVALAGMGLALLGRRRDTSSGVVRRRLAVRAVVFLVLGLGIQELDPAGISGILQSFAVLFAVAILLVDRDDRFLLRLGLLATLAGPLIHVVIETRRPDAIDNLAAALLDPPADVVASLLWSGAYPALVFFGPFVLGMWLGRQRLDHASVRWRLLVGGAAVAVVATTAGFVADALVGADAGRFAVLQADITIDSKSPLWMVNALGWETAILAVCLFGAVLVPRLMAPLAAMGQLSLTLYVAHLLVLVVLTESGRSTSVAGSAVRTVAATIVGLVVSVLWLRRYRKGPLEAAMAAATRLAGGGR